MLGSVEGRKEGSDDSERVCRNGEQDKEEATSFGWHRPNYIHEMKLNYPFIFIFNKTLRGVYYIGLLDFKSYLPVLTDNNQYSFYWYWRFKT